MRREFGVCRKTFPAIIFQRCGCCDVGFPKVKRSSARSVRMVQLDLSLPPGLAGGDLHVVLYHLVSGGTTPVVAPFRSTMIFLEEKRGSGEISACREATRSESPVSKRLRSRPRSTGTASVGRGSGRPQHQLTGAGVRDRGIGPRGVTRPAFEAGIPTRDPLRRVSRHAFSAKAKKWTFF